MPTARSKTWIGRLDNPTDEQLARLRAEAVENGLHLALKLSREGETVSSADVMIVYRQPRRAKPDGTDFPLPSWSTASFETEWPRLRAQWQDEGEFFPINCACAVCRGRKKECPPPVAGEPKPRRKRKRAADSVAAVEAELLTVRQELAAMNARWAKALPVLQGLLSPEALQSLFAGETLLPMAYATPMPTDGSWVATSGP